ncbi:protein jagged-2-like [Clupea harengus]|uniref:Delta-like protein n=1 Tax=Clupea harengus TaxID=7950 RepID=A0A6P8GBT0_CLUHA|nr:protein jagged-2-like [Clupea harengus]
MRIHLFAVWLLLTLWTEVCQCSGYLELQLMRVENGKGELANGECCVGSRRRSDGHCEHGDCETYFRACLKEYQTEVSATGPCTYGSGSTRVIGGNTFRLEGSATNPNRISDAGTIYIPFEFAWPRAFTLILEAWHWDNHSLTASEDLLIQRLTYKAVMNPGDESQPMHLYGDTATVELSLSVRCDKHYYGNKCNKQCRPRDDYFGHYVCDANGNRDCLEGWAGEDCTTAVCKPGCNPPQGRCEIPGECKCKVGWGGPLCNQCVPYPGCKHGSCVEPWQCRCNKNWGGILCDRDLNYCGTHQPCRNGGICSNPEPGQYSCQCPQGYSGRNCEIVIDSCTVAVATNSTEEDVRHISSNVCGAHGRCISQSGGSFTCACQPGFTGKYCHESDGQCDAVTCCNGGTCFDQGDSFLCVCAKGWGGSTCNTAINSSCDSAPCLNGGACIGGGGAYTCICKEGWEGPTCALLVGRVCVHAGVTFAHGQRWDQECNTCQCVNGDVHCTQVYCGPRPCLLEVSAAAPQRPLCAGGRQCVPHHFLSCLRPPCHQWGICPHLSPPVAPRTPCQPNSRYLDNRCARVTLVFNREMLPQGSTVEGVCSELQYWPIMRGLARDHPLLVLCDQCPSDSSAVGVAMSYVSSEHPEGQSQIQEVMRVLIEGLSKYHNSTLLLAIREVKVQTPEPSSSRDSLLPLLCVLFALLWLVCVCVCVCVLWTLRRRRDRERTSASVCVTRPPAEQEVNNHHRDNRLDNNHHRDNSLGIEGAGLLLERGRMGGDGAEEEEEEGGGRSSCWGTGAPPLSAPPSAAACSPPVPWTAAATRAPRRARGPGRVWV